MNDEISIEFLEHEVIGKPEILYDVVDNINNEKPKSAISIFILENDKPAIVSTTYNDISVASGLANAIVNYLNEKGISANAFMEELQNGVLLESLY